MKTKIFILLAVLISLTGINEIKAQMDTVWSYPMPQNYKPDAWAFSPNDSLITIGFSSSGDSIREGYNLLIKTATGEQIREFRGTHSSTLINTLFTPDNRYLITSALTAKHGCANIIMWNVSTGDSVRSFSIDSLENLNPFLNYEVSDLQFTPDGRYLFANLSLHYLNGDRAENYNHLVFWDTTSWQIAKQWTSLYQPTNLKISPRGNYYAFYFGKGDNGNCMKIVSLDSADTLIKNLYIGVNKSTFWTFSNNGKFLGIRCGMDSIIIWDMDTFSFFKSFYVHYIVNLSFATDSSYLVTNAPYSPTQIWNMYNSSLIYDYQDTAHKSGGMKLSHDGNYILISNFDKGMFYLYYSHFTPNPVVERGDNHELSIIYPNPSDKLSKLKFSSSELSIISIQIIDSEGNIVKDMGEKIFEQGENEINLDCSGLTFGIYFCRMIGKNLIKTFKIIIVR